MTQQKMKRKSHISIFLSYYKPHMSVFLLDMACALGVCLIDLLFPIASRTALNELLPRGSSSLRAVREAMGKRRSMRHTPRAQAISKRKTDIWGL